ncbi:MAG: hypothetical protein CMH64_04520 [Nanoarchaeota archaeon]|nr:hypothetical protein [Nanoarchaeota archaeon]|tara:strand:- start:6820 stop:7038 length:219 start_codon:yes stop_codon:yes gene_type:complete
MPERQLEPYREHIESKDYGKAAELLAEYGVGLMRLLMPLELIQHQLAFDSEGFDHEARMLEKTVEVLPYIRD